MKHILLLLALCAGGSGTLGARQGPVSEQSGGALSVETTLAGGPDDFLTLRHLMLEGTQREIGRRLFEVARDRHGWRAPEPPDSGPESLQRRLTYFGQHAPFFLERARGVADGLGLVDPGLDLTALGFGSIRGACTVIYYPPGVTESRTGVLSRNYDFSTGDFRGQRPAEGLHPVTSSPYLLETHPSQGYATLSMCAYDLLGGVIDGMNSEGLTIALLADDEVVQRFGGHPARGTVPGFGVLQIGRHVLETCADASEAKVAFRNARLYYSSIPCHYLVADRFGNSFIWENELSMKTGYVFEGAGEVQVSTNFMHHLHLGDEELPQDGRLGSFTRFRTVTAQVERAEGPLDLEFMRRTSARVCATLGEPTATGAPGRTLWRTLYFPEERRVEIDVYLGETQGEDGPLIRRSDWVSVELATRNRPDAPAR